MTDTGARLEQLLEDYVERGVIPGAVAAVGDDVVAVGAASTGGPPMQTDAIFRIQSMTKAVTSVAALRFVEEGRIGLEDAIDEWMPELAQRRVLRTPTAQLDDSVPASRPITLRHLLTNTSGYGSIMVESPLARAMTENGTEGGPQSPELDAEEWLRRIATLPLAFQPGEGWRYHHSFAILGILLSRLAGAPLGEHLRRVIFDPLGMPDTDFSIPMEKAHRLPPAYRDVDGELVETEPAGAGFSVGPPPFDVSHGELVSTAADFMRFERMLARGGDGIVSPEHLRLMTTDQVPDRVKTDDSFFPGFWSGTGWGFGVAVVTAGEHRGRYGWSGGQGTDFYVDPDGTPAVLLTQVEMGGTIMPLLSEFQSVRDDRR
ncbi:serine hydrolase [Microbacterium aoyamense]|uniref:Serine hydrolase n=1 Tax=Microbacterium aoyamense TaxID=344166 RepID=A0ABP5ASV9_9MICO|nr:serine hydrolase domain-containing protein [Microbacterium aoyamense]